MGINNRQRRAAKQRKRSRDRARTSGPGGGTNGSRGPNGSGPGFRADDPLGGYRAWEHDEQRAIVDSVVGVAVQRLTGRRSVSTAEAIECARDLLSHLHPVPMRTIGQAVADLVGGLGSEAVHGGWSDSDLQELVARRVGEEHVGLLQTDARTATVAKCTLETLAPLLRVAAALGMVPLAEWDASTRHRQGTGRPAMSEEKAKRLARVRALLAKAEATSFDEEAEALSAKAQELISRHALERLLQEDTAATASEGPSVRRIWLDAPYVLSKATLVDAVSRANRCRCVVSEALAVCSVVGDSSDLESVELLSTSLLVQANRSMLRHGRHLDHRGVSRTRSFRQSFLMSFAIRIGQRLQEVNQEAIRATERGTDLVPVLRNQEQRVEEAFETMFPHIFKSETTVSNGHGWAAGHAAADLALLDVNAHLAPAAEPG